MEDRAFSYRYSGGSLNAEDPTYVMRQADLEFYNGLKSGEFCYVLNSRQMGKSSLRVRTMAKLQEEGVICAFIDLTGIGKEGVTSEQWYANFLRDLVNSCLSLKKFNWRKWWRQQRDLLSPVQRLKVFIEEILLVEVRSPIVIFVDEIDRVLSLDFSLDDFFALVRACYEYRGIKSEYKRLTWSFLGVATPSDLINNPNVTPFNIGRAIPLNGFQLTESLVLEKGLVPITDYPGIVLKEILVWTGGQPFLTQKLCWLVANIENKIPRGKESECVAKLVKEKLIINWESQDEPPHLKTIQNRIIYSSKSKLKLLLLYQKILRRGKITFKKFVEYRELQLSGLVVRQGRNLKSYNPIYQSVFNGYWVKKQLLISDKSAKFSWRIIFLVSVTFAFLVTGIRSSSLLENLELSTYDLLMNNRPVETEDSRLLIIGVTEKDLKTYGFPLSDRTLAQLLDRLEKYQPKAIGLDIVRDNPVPKEDLFGYENFTHHLKRNNKLIAICTFNSNSGQEISPPKESPEIQLGFVNLYNDRFDTIRRYLLSRSFNNPSEKCPTSYSFALQLISLYLEDTNIAIDTVKDNWRFGSLITKRLEKRSGGYQNLDSRGNKILINYRHTKNIAREISLGNVLNSQNTVNPDLIKDKIILIGVTASSIQDWHLTPYGNMRGIYVHAHAISQIISAIEDKRPLIWWLPVWGDFAVIWIWSSIAGFIIWYFKNPFKRNIAIGILLIFLYGFCWFIFLRGGWLPLIPSAIAILGTTIVLVRWKFIRKKYNHIRFLFLEVLDRYIS